MPLPVSCPIEERFQRVRTSLRVADLLLDRDQIVRVDDRDEIQRRDLLARISQQVREARAREEDPTVGIDLADGVLGVLGPTRMPYDKIVGLVDHTSRLVEGLLQ